MGCLVPQEAGQIESIVVIEAGKDFCLFLRTFSFSGVVRMRNATIAQLALSAALCRLQEAIDRSRKIAISPTPNFSQ
jgi:hypothetical protein